MENFYTQRQEIAQFRRDVRNTFLTLREVVRFINGNDAVDPILQIPIGGIRFPVQTSHITFDQLLTIDGLADSKWTFESSTQECVDIFVISGLHDAGQWFDWEHRKPYSWESEKDVRGQYWVTPKAFPRPQ